jgi:predicted enzyme related to lactoylglutathione lyase
MPVIEKHPQGSFCWMELNTTDQAAGKHFYTSLFGWDAMEFPMGPSEIYTIFQMQGKDCSAACTLRKDLQAQGVPSHWMLYIAADDVDTSTKRAAEVGGKVMAGPFDVGESGRMSVIQDPTGAVFCLWQGKQTPGIGIAGVANAFCWADLNTRERDAAKKFYQGLFGWAMVPGQGKDESAYWHIQNGEQMIGGIPPAEVLPPHIPSHWMVYYQVDSCVAMTEKAGELGARVYVNSMPVEGAGILSVLEDPQGAAFALFEVTR